MANLKKRSNKVQFNTRVNPAPLKAMRKIAKKRDVNLGIVVEEAMVAYLAAIEQAAA